MKATIFALLSILTLTLGCTSLPQESSQPSGSVRVIELPEPRLKGEVSLEEALFKRRSVREYTDVPLSLGEVSQLLWAAQGITEGWGGRTSPSAGGLYPLEVYLTVGKVEGLAAGIYKYQPEGHEVHHIIDADIQVEVAKASLDQVWVREGAAVIIIAAIFEKTTSKYGERGIRYVHLEAGHAAQNICLQATALGLGAVTVGAFDDEKLKLIAGMSMKEAPLYVIPVGKRN